MDLTSRLRSIVQGSVPRADVPPAAEPDTAVAGVRELTYEPDDGYRAATPLDLDRVASSLGGRRISTRFGECMVIDRRYESDRWHGDVRIGDCEIGDIQPLRLLDPELPSEASSSSGAPRTIFIDLETTGLSGGAGTLAFLVGCGYFDLGAFQVRQFLLTSHSGERALLAAVAEFFEGVELIVTYNGKTFDVPVMETRWMFHRIGMPLEGVPHFDMLHTARRLWKNRSGTSNPGEGLARSRRTYVSHGDPGGCRLATLERLLFDVRRVGDVPAFEIPSRFFRFVRNGDPNPLEPILEHNRIDLVSLAAVTARAARLAQEGHDACRDCSEALALGRILERAAQYPAAQECFRRASQSPEPLVRGEALYRLGLRLRRERCFTDAAAIWRELIDFTEPRRMRSGLLSDLRQFAAEALAIHREHRARDLHGARDLTLASLEEAGGRSESFRHRLARLERKLARINDFPLFSN